MATQEKLVNRQIQLASRPKGMVDLANFAMHKGAVPAIGEGQVLVHTEYLTVDPYMRGRMNDRKSYVEPFAIHKPLTGGVVGKVVESKSPLFKTGDYVYGFLEWADYSVEEAKRLRKLDPKQAPVSTALGVLGMPGMTAYFGLLDIGQPKKGKRCSFPALQEQ